MTTNLGESTDDRDPTIMSAIGVNDRYQFRLERGALISDDLVLDSYPLSFLHEAQAKFGGPFFETTWTRNALKQLKLYHVLALRPIGSMMPFTRLKGWISGLEGIAEFSSVKHADHASVRTWRIRQDAGV